MSQKMEERIEPKDYDKIKAKFVSEYGYVGPCCRETTFEYLDQKDDGTDPDRTSKMWWWHSNVFEKGTVETAINKNYNVDAAALSLDDYITYGGMVHGLMYGYSLEAMKFKKHCFGSLIWMYNDAWGEVGWTIIDYYLRRKIPFYAVKRALAHRRLAMRLVDGKVVLQGINDTPEELTVSGKFGYAAYDGSLTELRDISFTVPAGERAWVLSETLPERDFTRGTMMFYPDDPSLDSAYLRMDDMKKLAIPAASVIFVNDEKRGSDRVLTVRSETFAHGVHVDGEYRCSDQYFDLLPGESKTFVVKDAADAALTVKTVI